MSVVLVRSQLVAPQAWRRRIHSRIDFGSGPTISSTLICVHLRLKTWVSGTIGESSEPNREWTRLRRGSFLTLFVQRRNVQLSGRHFPALNRFIKGPYSPATFRDQCIPAGIPLLLLAARKWALATLAQIPRQSH